MTETEWAEGVSVDERQAERCYWRRLAGFTLGAALVVYLLLALVSKVYAAAIFGLENNGVTVTLYTEDCQLKTVSNLPYRATWVEGGKTFEGCWGARPEAGVVLGFFDDGSIAMMPIQAFRKLVGA